MSCRHLAVYTWWEALPWVFGDQPIGQENLKLRGIAIIVLSVLPGI